MSEAMQLDKVYAPKSVEGEMYAKWLKADCFAARPDDRPRDQRFTIVIPPPNVTGALHLGHALNNTLQDILIRWHRMMGHNTLWLPGTDHAGIATQAVVEKRLRENEGKNRHDIGREALVDRIWAWKDQYEKRILSQLQLIGCSCDWSRKRFTLDDGLAQAVRHTFFRFFKDGLIFRGKRLVNWDTHLQTAVADDELSHETVKGHFWHFKYPVNNPQPGEPTHVIIATTRPETMLGDTAVAVHPDPARGLDRLEADLKEKLTKAPAKEKSAIQADLDRIAERRQTHLPLLTTLRDMANAGRTLTLPLVNREIPLVTDEHADPSLGSGCVKITPAHDHNDYEVGLRCNLPMLNMMNADGTVNENGGPYVGLTMPEARKRVVADLDEQGLLLDVEDRQIEIGHSDRSKSPIEPYLSDQWFVRMGELADGAMKAVTDGRVQFFPERYAKSYLDWLGEKRDWCISRQLWWGHRIPIWTTLLSLEGVSDSDFEVGAEAEYRHLAADFEEFFRNAGIEDSEWCIRHDTRTHVQICPGSDRAENALAALARFFDSVDLQPKDEGEQRRALSCVPGFEKTTEAASAIIARVLKLQQDPDVLDTWFSSALWPYSTLGWPDETEDLKYYYPSSVLITSRDIITNWVARMVLTGLYNMGDIPFDHVYIHAKILDGRGETMSKSKGNGVDPLDCVAVYGADALRYTMADMATETQDVRMPVDYICPHCGHLIPQTTVVPGGKQPIDVHRVTCKDCKQKFATQWATDAIKAELPVAHETSEKFEIGRNFCNKLWNSARFAFMNLEGAPCESLDVAALPPEDRWILAQLSATARNLQEELRGYHYSAAIRLLRDYFWDSFCDWYIELTKPRLRDPATAGPTQQILAFVLDQVLRMMSPFLPFITEKLWEELNRIAPRRGLPGVVDLAPADVLMTAPFPPAGGYPAFDDPHVLEMFADIQSAVRGVRDLRNKCNVPVKDKVKVTIKAAQTHIDLLADQRHIIAEMAGVGDMTLVTEADRPKNAGTTVVGPLQIFVHDISDDDEERKRLQKELASVEQRLKACENKLSNEKFTANAKPEVVAAERERLEELAKSHAAVVENLKDLGA